jgi:ribose transport system ATP-binding protein
VGREVDTKPSPTPDSRRATPEVLLEVENLSAPPRLRVASFKLHRGEILGIAGLVGSGRSDLVRALFGLHPSAGVVRVRGRALGNLRSARQIRNGFGYLSEDRKGEGLALQLPIADNVTMTRLATCSRGGWIDRDQQNAQTEDVITRLRIKAPGPRGIVGKLSGGNQQKVALAKWLTRAPKVLVMVEPTRGMDVGAKEDVVRIVKSLAAEGMAVIILSTEPETVLSLADRVLVMRKGEIGSEFKDCAISKDRLLAAA